MFRFKKLLLWLRLFLLKLKWSFLEKKIHLSNCKEHEDQEFLQSTFSSVIYFSIYSVCDLWNFCIIHLISNHKKWEFFISFIFRLLFFNIMKLIASFHFVSIPVWRKKLTLPPPLHAFEANVHYGCLKTKRNNFSS